jgi:hypothetical protein
MAVKLGTSSVTLKLGTQSVTGYLGSAIVTATVPGAPTITNAIASEGNDESEVTFTPPESDGGSPITGYKFYFDGAEQTPDIPPTDGGGGNFFAGFFPGYRDQSAEVSAVNAVGEGPRSAPVTVT